MSQAQQALQELQDLGKYPGFTRLLDAVDEQIALVTNKLFAQETKSVDDAVALSTITAEIKGLTFITNVYQTELDVLTHDIESLIEQLTEEETTENDD